MQFPGVTNQQMRIGKPVISGTSGSVLFIDSSGNLAQNNSQYFWDNTNFRQGIGTASPSSKLHIVNTAATDVGFIVQSHTSQIADIFRIVDSSSNKILYLNQSGLTRLLGFNSSITSATQIFVVGDSSTYSIFNDLNLEAFVFSPTLKAEISQTSGTNTLFSNYSTFINNTALANGSYIGSSIGNYDNPTFTADTNSYNVTQSVSVLSQPIFGVLNSGTLSVASCSAVWFSPIVNTGATVTNLYAFRVSNKSGSGNVTNFIGLELDSISGGTTITAGIRSSITSGSTKYFINSNGSAASVHLGTFSIGSTSQSVSQLTITCPSSGIVGQIIKAAASQSVSLLQLQDSAGDTHSGFYNNAATLFFMSSARTVSANNALVTSEAATLTVSGSNVVSYFLSATHTISYTVGQSFLTGTFLFNNTTTVRNATSLTGNLGSYACYNNQTNIVGDTNATTMSNYFGFRDNCTLSRVNSGTLTLSSYDSFRAAPGDVGAGCTVTTHRGVYIQNPSNSGTITTNTRLEIDDVSTGTTKIAIRQKGTSGHNRFQADTSFGQDSAPGALIDVAGKLFITSSGLITKYNNQTTTGTGVPYLLQSPSISATKTANFTVFSYTPAASAATYRVCGIITTTSATNTGTVQFTLDYVDSQGTTHTADIIPLVDAAGVIATTKTGASKEFHSMQWLFTVDNSATAIALKVVITGTVSYTVTGTIERVI